jgi:hypothetical protein
MAVYKIFPTQDATLYSLFPQMNTGLDQIIEATTTTFGYSDPFPQTSRFLIQFSNSEINDILNNKVGDNDWEANLRVFLSTVTGLSQESFVVCNPVAKEWRNGTGKYLDQPITTDGTSWEWANYSGSNLWSTGVGSIAYATMSYSSSVVAGGGAWFTGSDNTNYPNVKSSQSFSLYDDKDLNFNVTPTVHNWYSESLSNYGFIVRQTESQEFVFSLDQQVELKYFSVDTNTIYPPVLEIKWDDFSFITSSNINEITSSNIQVSLDENPGIFYSESINRFRINCRPKYPSRTFATASYYSTNYYLPTASYWAIKDLYTNEFVVDFDSTYTKISADSDSSYFDVYMNGLQPERWYKILIQTTVGNSTLVMDDNYTFKVVNG